MSVPADMFAALRDPETAVSRFTDLDWYKQFGPVLERLGRRLERAEYGFLWQHLRSCHRLYRAICALVRSPSEGFCLSRPYSELTLRDATGDVLGGVMADKIMRHKDGVFTKREV